MRDARIVPTLRGVHIQDYNQDYYHRPCVHARSQTPRPLWSQAHFAPLCRAQLVKQPATIARQVAFEWEVVRGVVAPEDGPSASRGRHQPLERLEEPSLLTEELARREWLEGAMTHRLEARGVAIEAQREADDEGGEVVGRRLEDELCGAAHVLR